jgi:hypothetical protein
MDELQPIINLLDDITNGNVTDIESIKTIVAAAQSSLRKQGSPDREKRRKITQEFAGNDHRELDDAISALLSLPRVYRIVQTNLGKSHCPLKELLHDLHSCFPYNEKYTMADVEDFFHAYLLRKDRFFTMSHDDFMKELLYPTDNIQCSRTERAFIVYNATKNIALRTVIHQDGICKPHSFRQHFFQGENISKGNALDSHCDSSSPLTLMAYVQNTLAPDQVCLLQSPSTFLRGCELCIEPFFSTAWWKEVFTWIAELMWRGSYEIHEEEITGDDHGAWSIAIMDTFGIYCYRDPAGEIDTITFTDETCDIASADGYEIHPSNAHQDHEWTRQCIRANLEIVQQRTLAMLDRVSWFRGDREPFKDIKCQ